MKIKSTKNKLITTLGVLLMLPLSTLVSAQETELTYEEEVTEVLEQGLVTKNPTSEANKCEVLQIVARHFEWDLNSETEHPFTDVPEWCDDLANYAYENEIVTGRTETTLGLESPVSRFEVATILHRELTRHGFEFTTFAEVPYMDSKNTPEWAEDAIFQLTQHGILKGYEVMDSEGYATHYINGKKGILKQDLGVLLVRIGSVGHHHEPSHIDTDLVGRWEWTETHIKTGLNNESTKTADTVSKPFVLTLKADTSFGITGDCNLMGGNFSTEEESVIGFHDLISTLMYCEGSYEHTFSSTLLEVSSYSFVNEEQTELHLVATDAEKEETVTLKFTKLAEPQPESLEGTWTWEETHMNDGETTSTSDVLAVFSIVFGEDNSFSIIGDCNSMGGSAETSVVDNENTIKFEGVYSTEMYCEDSYEGTFSTDLTSTSTYRFDDEEKTVLIFIMTDEEGEYRGYMKFNKNTVLVPETPQE